MDDHFEQFRRQAQEMQSLVDGSLRFFRESQAAIECTPRALRDAVSSMATMDMFSAHTAFSHFAEQFSENAKLVSNALATLATPSAVSAMASYLANQQRYMDDWKSLGEPLPNITEGIRAQIESASTFALAANKALETMDLDGLGSAISSATREQERVWRTTVALSDHHASFVSSLSLATDLATGFPPFVSKMPSLDLFVHTEAVRAVTPHESYQEDEEAHSLDLRVRVADETDTFLEVTLVRLKPAFLGQFHGFLDRAAERGPDWWGQAAASARKLLLGVLHTSAPDAVVLPWITDPKKQLDRNGHPTRAAKVAWLCQFIPNESYRRYVRTEIESALALIDLLDSAVHVDDFPELEEAFSWTTLRLKVAIRHILTIWQHHQKQH
jgi:hypothetical protein